MASQAQPGAWPVVGRRRRRLGSCCAAAPAGAAAMSPPHGGAPAAAPARRLRRAPPARARAPQTGFLQQHKARLAREIASLRREAEALNTPSTYAKCAKLQRLANAKEQELSSLQQHGESDMRARIAAGMATAKVRVRAWRRQLARHGSSRASRASRPRAAERRLGAAPVVGIAARLAAAARRCSWAAVGAQPGRRTGCAGSCRRGAARRPALRLAPDPTTCPTLRARALRWW